ncbi:hypothetical protein EMIT047CA2_50242 [Pseudomonas soli]
MQQPHQPSSLAKSPQIRRHGFGSPSPDIRIMRNAIWRLCVGHLGAPTSDILGLRLNR